MTELIVHHSDAGCKVQRDLSHFNVTEKADAGLAVLPPDHVLSGGFQHICRARLCLVVSSAVVFLARALRSNLSVQTA